MITGVIDYGAGNLRSVLKAVESLERETRLVRESTDLDGVDALILPGVGAFGDCSTQLHEQSLIEPVRLWIREDRPYLGICLGYQILFEGSEESPGAPG
ncbi:MAG: imidazole glycerol phosphate synthase subunit HisH, partial [Verrucomicrobiota bacterium]